MLRRVAATAGGNPLFALEIARALGSDASIEPGMPLPVPDNLRELVTRRVAALPDAARAALLAASALTHPSAAAVERPAVRGCVAVDHVSELHDRRVRRNVTVRQVRPSASASSEM